MKAPFGNLCPFHTRTLGRGIFARTENVKVELKDYKVKNKDGSIESGKYCPRCHATFNGKD